MCLAIPAKVASVDHQKQTAIVAFGSVKKEVSVALLEAVAEGDFVLVHVGYALNRISPEEAARTLELMREMGLAEEAAA